MAIDYKSLRNTLDANVNQTGFAQLLADTFIAPLFKQISKTVYDTVKGQSTEPTPSATDAGNPSKSKALSPQEYLQTPEGQEWAQNSSLTGLTGGEHLDGYVTIGGLTANMGIGTFGGQIYSGYNVGDTVLAESIPSVGPWVLDYRKRIPLIYQAHSLIKPVFENNLNLYKQGKLTPNVDTTSFSSRTEEEKEQARQPTTDQQFLQTVLQNTLSTTDIRAIDTATLSKYVSPNAATGLQRLLSSIFGGNIPADTLTRMASGNFNAQDEAFRLITQNPQDFAGISSYGGITTGFQASALQDANRIDTKKILSQTTTGEQFRKTLSTEIAKVIQSTTGAKRAGQSFQLDARFDVNAETQILQQLKTDLAGVARQAGKQGTGLGAFVSQMYDAFGASSYTGAAKTFATSAGETLQTYQHRLAREVESRTPKSYLEADSPYLRMYQFAQNTRTDYGSLLGSNQTLGF